MSKFFFRHINKIIDNLAETSRLTEQSAEHVEKLINSCTTIEQLTTIPAYYYQLMTNIRRQGNKCRPILFFKRFHKDLVHKYTTYLHNQCLQNYLKKLQTLNTSRQ